LIHLKGKSHKRAYHNNTGQLISRKWFICQALDHNTLRKKLPFIFHVSDMWQNGSAITGCLLWQITIIGSVYNADLKCIFAAFAIVAINAPNIWIQGNLILIIAGMKENLYNSRWNWNISPCIFEISIFGIALLTKIT